MSSRAARLLPYLQSGVSDPYPGVTVYDQFTDADGTALTSHVPDKAPAGSAWAHVAGTWQINANRAKWVSNTGAYAIAAIESGKADCVITAVLQRNFAGYAGIACRVINASNYIIITINAANQFQAVRRFGGAASILATVSPVTISVNTDYAIEITLSGTSIVATLDGGNTINTSYANLTAATKHGLYGEGASQFDNFQVV